MVDRTLQPYNYTIDGGSYKPLPMAGDLMTGYPGANIAAAGTTPGEIDPSNGNDIPPSPAINP